MNTRAAVMFRTVWAFAVAAALALASRAAALRWRRQNLFCALA